MKTAHALSLFLLCLSPAIWAMNTDRLERKIDDLDTVVEHRLSHIEDQLGLLIKHQEEPTRNKLCRAGQVYRMSSQEAEGLLAHALEQQKRGAEIEPKTFVQQFEKECNDSAILNTLATVCAVAGNEQATQQKTAMELMSGKAYGYWQQFSQRCTSSLQSIRTMYQAAHLDHTNADTFIEQTLPIGAKIFNALGLRGPQDKEEWRTVLGLYCRILQEHRNGRATICEQYGLPGHVFQFMSGDYPFVPMPDPSDDETSNLASTDESDESPLDPDDSSDDATSNQEEGL